MTDIPPFELTITTTDPELATLARTYWELEGEEWAQKVRDIALAMGMGRGALLEQVRAACEVRVPSIQCSTCGTIETVSSRNQLQSLARWAGRHHSCSSCRSKSNTFFNRPPEVPRSTMIDPSVEMFWSLFVKFCESQVMRLPGRYLTLERVVVFLALLRGGDDDGGENIQPVSDFDPPLSPSDDLSRDFLTDLLDAGFIGFHPATSKNAIDSLRPDGSVSAYYPLHVTWIPLVGHTSMGTSHVIETLRFLLDNEDRWPTGWWDQTGPLWKKLASHEVVGYLDLQLRERGLHVPHMERALAVAEGVLANYSVAQAYNLARQAAVAASDFRTRESATERHASNYAVKALAGRAEHATAMEWDVYAFRRDFRRPESMVWRVLFDLALKVDGFETAPWD